MTCYTIPGDAETPVVTAGLAGASHMDAMTAKLMNALKQEVRGAPLSCVLLHLTRSKPCDDRSVTSKRSLRSSVRLASRPRLSARIDL